VRGPGGYGRYDDDPKHVGCPRARSDMTPCVARDGGNAETLDAATGHQHTICVGCGRSPADLLRELVAEVTEPVTT